MRVSALASEVVQYCLVVKDVEAAVAAWSRDLGAGPFFLLDPFVGVRERPDGSQSRSVARIALGQCGPVQIELVELIEGTDSIFSQATLGTGVAGFHHVAVFAHDLEAAVADFAGKGFAWWQRSDDIVFIDCRDSLGFFVEIYRGGRGIEAVYEKIARAAAGWDGSRPLRPYVEM
ncbi:VOC family protein [Novosphingobium bradum]|uniref:VOC family protein n=1 Tax=Novosphingobium bradum TaxID=1737444 RepID=A0ABV7IN65_9SPHN